MKFNRIVLSGLIALAGAVLYGCGGDDDSSEPTPCNVDPSNCGAGETCWADLNFKATCLPSGTAQDGDPCQSLAGTAECGDNLWCGPSSTADSGVCTVFCDANDSCPDGRHCLVGRLQNPQTGETIDYHVCAPIEEATGMAGAGGA